MVTVAHANASGLNNSPNSPTIIAPYKMDSYDKVIKALYQTVPRHQNTEERIASFSAYFLGKPYLFGALGEGPSAKFDQSPFYRTDAFDCLTYVNTVLALVESNSWHDFPRTMAKVSYRDGVVNFAQRNHFVSVDWNPVNQKNGFLVDVTQSLFPTETKTAYAVINKPNWFRHLTANRIKLFEKPPDELLKKLLADLHALGDKATVMESRLPYLPLTALYDKGEPVMRLFNRIPSGTVIEIVRPHWDLRKTLGTFMQVSHLGLGMRVNGTLMFREASLVDHRVEDVSLAEYLKHYLDSPTIKGINVEKIRHLNPS